MHEKEVFSFQKEKKRSREKVLDTFKILETKIYYTFLREYALFYNNQLYQKILRDCFVLSFNIAALKCVIYFTFLVLGILTPKNKTKQKKQNKTKQNKKQKQNSILQTLTRLYDMKMYPDTSRQQTCISL